MTVTVVMHGTLRRFLPEGAARATLDLHPGITIGELLAGLGADQDTWLVARNQAIAERDAVLAPGDVLDCFEPLAGGAGGETPGVAGRLPEEPCRYAT